MKNSNYTERMPRARADRLVIQNVDDETLVYDLDKDKAICLNETSKLVWGLCDGKSTINETAELLSDKLKIDTNHDLVTLTLDELRKANLLDDNSVFLEDKSGVSRRNLITQYGIPMAVLPIVMSLVAPLAVHAQSCAAPFQTCAVPSDCCDIDAVCFGAPSVCRPN